MPIVPIENMLMVSPNFLYSEKYWTILSNYVSTTYGTSEITEPKLVQNILKECFKLLEKEFLSLINTQNKASFYLYVHNFHENSIELWQKEVNGVKLDINKTDFNATRRILKIILEQSCALNLVGAVNFGDEMFQNRFEYLQQLEELLYLGYWAIGISEYIARGQLFPKSIGIRVKNKELNILIYPIYKHLFDFIDKDIPRHSSKVVLDDTITEFKQILKVTLGLDYDILASITNEQLSNPNYRFGVMKIQDLIDFFVKEKNYNREYLTDYYNGLTVTSNNYLSFENCIIKNQDIHRHTYRPILQMNIDNQVYCIIGRNKWLESMLLLSTNAIPFGWYPNEWQKHIGIKNFVNQQEDRHDSILEIPIMELLEKYCFKFDNNVKSLKQLKGNNINIDKKQGIGEIDIIFLDEKDDILYICECKHLRSRFDVNNWKRDYSNFKDKYETQLDNKTNWAEQNIDNIRQHFIKKYNLDDLDLSNYEVVGLFVINAPTLYMYNGKYRVVTILDFENILTGNFIDKKFLFTDENTGKETLITYPYFDSIDANWENL